MTPIGVGIDHCEVSRMQTALDRWGAKFTERVFTPGEILYCDSYKRGPAARYAARFAAKEATAKALGTGVAMGVNWREIEVTRAPRSAPELKLHGKTAEIAREKGATAFLLSVTHTDHLASAVVIALG